MDEIPASFNTAEKRPRKHWRILIGLILAVCALAVGILHRCITRGGLHARQKPSAFESFLAAELVELSIPRGTKALQKSSERQP